MNEQAITTVEFKEMGLSSLGEADELKKRLEANTDRIKVVHEYISENFKEGIDYGPTDKRSDKKTLMKPGAEKVTKLFNTSPRWRRDTDTWEMLGKPAGTVCYICEIIDNATGHIIGEGRGAEKVGNKSRDANKAIKIAEKCALVDAALFTFNLSDIFTQDLPPASGNNLESMKTELISDVETLRIDCGSTMTAHKFLWEASKAYLNMDSPQTIGQLNALRTAIFDDGLFDLATAKRIPQ